MSKEGSKKRKYSRSFILQALTVFVVGSLIGVGAYTFIFAKGFAYFGSESKTCVNCHVMEPQYQGWMNGPHAHVATCNDCHTPHDSIVHKYYVKATDGFIHGWKFTTGTYPEHIQIRESNRKVANNACLHCHADFTHDIRLTAGDEQVQCTRCHTDVGHRSR